MTTINEIADQAKLALIDSKLILENTLEDLKALLVPFADVPAGITIAGIGELKSIQLNISNQLSMIDNAQNTFLTPEERNAKMLTGTAPMMAPPMMSTPPMA